MSLAEQLVHDLTEAMKSRQADRLAVLRMVKAEAQKLRADRGVDAQLTEEDYLTILRRQIKSRKDAAALYSKSDSADAKARVEAELAEAAILEAYLPKQMTDEELEEVVRSVVSQLSNPSPKDMGRVMGQVMPKVAGLAEGDRVRQMVTRLLAN